jgi:lipid II:glycine glycyltransferase (peptidoglycan interpeptide bridge formation enzyme)
VYVDLAESEETTWRQIRRDHRSGIRKLRSLGFEAVVDDWTLVCEFERIYRETMERVAADDSYLFDGHYFAELRRALGDALHLWVVRAPGGGVAAAGLFTEMCGTVQFHLSGTDADYARQAPSKLMLYAVMQWARGRGNRFFHLGGGLGARNDSLFRFKAGFSPHRGAFQTLRIVPDPPRYDTLVSARGAAFATDSPADAAFFPRYRAPRATAAAPSQDNDRG